MAKRVPASDCYEYVRNYYGVPAYIGMTVSFKGKDAVGTIVKATTALHYVHVVFEGTRHSVPCHPTDLLYKEITHVR
jgi:hypothetical protein